jgi:hypothetical protein
MSRLSCFSCGRPSEDVVRFVENGLPELAVADA